MNYFYIIFTLNLDSIVSVDSGLSSTWRVALRCFVAMVLDVELDTEKNKQFIIRYYDLNQMAETYLLVIQMLKLCLYYKNKLFFSIFIIKYIICNIILQ